MKVYSHWSLRNYTTNIWHRWLIYGSLAVVIPALRFLAALLLLASLSYTAAQSPNDIASELENKTVLLRGSYAQDKLSFDPQGNLIGDAFLAPFSLSGVSIEKVHLSDKELVITGCRGLLYFSDPVNSSIETIRLLPMNEEKITITVARDSAHPESVQAAIHNIFAASPAEALSLRSLEQRQSSLETLASLAPQLKEKSAEPAPSDGKNTAPAIPHAKITPPRILHSVTLTPNDFPPNSSCLITAIVDKNGFPTRIHPVHCVDQFVTLRAIAAVGQYRFQPATSEGNPVSVAIGIEVAPHLMGHQVGR